MTNQNAILDDILKKLKLIQPVLIENYALSDLGLFGSVLRSDFSADSDLDLLVSFSKPIGFEIVDMVMYLEKEFGRRVDVMTKDSLKSPLKEIIEGEVQYV
jgi:predicted nucleotidyltransferase